MAETKITQIELLSQQLSKRFKSMDELMSQAWFEHELTRESFRNLLKTYYEWLGKEGIEYEL